MGLRGSGNKFKTGSVNSANLVYGKPQVVKAAKSGSKGYKFGGRTVSDGGGDGYRSGYKAGGKIVGGMKPVKKARGGSCGASPFSSAHIKMRGDA